MTTRVGGKAAVTPEQTFTLLDAIVALFGATKTTFWPMLESTGSVLQSYLEQVHPLTATDAGTDGFYPFKHRGGVMSYSFNAGDEQHLVGEDHADFEFGDSANDLPFSVGCFILPRDITSVALICKWNENGGYEDREWQLALEVASKPRFTIYDESATAYEEAVADTALTANEWVSIVAAYDGTEDDPEIFLYANGAADNDGTTGETNAYVAMEAGATPLEIGATNDTDGDLSALYSGRMALMFICGKKLVAAEAAAYHALGVQLLGS